MTPRRAQGEPLPSILEIVENALTVSHLATMELEYVDPRSTVEDALDFLQRKGFDVAPVREARPRLFVEVRDLTGGVSEVSEVARPIDAPHLVTSTLGLADAVRLLRELPYYFVMEGDHLAGIVTRADLQRQAVSMVTMSLILAAELGMNHVIEFGLGSGWADRLGETARRDVEGIYADRARANAEIGLVECLMLHHRLDLFRECPGALEELGYSGRAFGRWKKQIVALRDTLAHGGGLLHCQPDPLEAIDLFGRVRAFAEGVWTVSGARE